MIHSLKQKKGVSGAGGGSKKEIGLLWSLWDLWWWPFRIKQFPVMAPRWRHSQMKASRNGTAHLRVNVKADLDIDKHCTDSPDPCTLIKANSSRAVTGLSSLGCKAGNCPIRNLQKPWLWASTSPSVWVRPEVHTIMKGPFSCVAVTLLLNAPDLCLPR